MVDKKKMRWKPALSAVVISVALLTAAGAAGAMPGPLDRPAQGSAHARGAVLVAIANAGSRLVAVGERGIVLLSDDNGAAWRQAQVPVSVTLTAVRFVTASEGWAVGHGGTVLHTRDGGETWTKQLDGRQAASMLLERAEARMRRNQGDPRALARELEDAQRLVAEGPDKPFLDLHFVNANTGFVVGAYNLIFRTDDGGKSWQSMDSRIDNPKGLHLYAIGGAGPDLYIVGEQGCVFHSADGGDTFVPLTTPYNGSYFGLVTRPGGELVAFGMRGNAYRSRDRGVSWQKVDVTSNASLAAGTWLRDGRLALVDQSGRLLLSSDQGAHFGAASLSQTTPLAGIAQAANGEVIMVGQRGVVRFRPAMAKREGQ